MGSLTRGVAEFVRRTVIVGWIDVAILSAYWSLKRDA